MKTFSAAFLLFAAAATTAVNAFSAPKPPVRRDSAKLVEEALKQTATFGIDSDEARVAWDIVEEVDATKLR